MEHLRVPTHEDLLAWVLYDWLSDNNRPVTPRRLHDQLLEVSFATAPVLWRRLWNDYPDFRKRFAPPPPSFQERVAQGLEP